ncbi:MAG: aldehyde dehydrogenase family protein [Planctomycetota bacterium]|nr:aldehyde dehydrogenase family protein [Planctomycetota bacterium]
MTVESTSPIHAFETTNPATGEVLSKITISQTEDVHAAVAAARHAQPAWAAQGIAARIDALEKVAARFENQDLLDNIAQQITAEMGKPVEQAGREAAAVAPGIRRLGQACAEALEPEQVEEGETTSLITREPLGVVAAITPWNFPLGMAKEVIVPALVAGNTVVFKPSEITPLSGEAFLRPFVEELPAGVVQLVQGLEEAGRDLVAADIDMVGFVGSVTAGRHIMAACAPSLKRIVLELGGKDPMIVCEGADLEAAADFAVRESMRNTGQVCCSVERIYVERSVAEAFTDKVVEKAKEVTFGDGQDDVFMGPMAHKSQRDNVLSQIDDATSKGADLLYGGKAADRPGWFMLPTVITNVDESMDILREETFGPVATIRPVDNVEEAVHLANASEFGLGASVWTSDNQSGCKVASQLESGQVGVNRGLGGAGDPPWCGAKQSGFGFLGSADGYRQFTRPRTLSWNKE